MSNSHEENTENSKKAEVNSFPIIKIIQNTE